MGLRLYIMLNWLEPSQVMHCDADLVMIIYEENDPLHKSPYKEAGIEDGKTLGIQIGTGLGMREADYSNHDYIAEIVIAGPKSHIYSTNRENTVCKNKT